MTSKEDLLSIIKDEARKNPLQNAEVPDVWNRVKDRLAKHEFDEMLWEMFVIDKVIDLDWGSPIGQSERHVFIKDGRYRIRIRGEMEK